MRFHPMKSLRTPKVATGFSLMEVILGSFLTIFVVTVAGIGLVNFSRSDIINTADSELGNNLNRASDFISDELRQAKEVKTEASISSTNIPSGSTPVLGIVNPNFATQIVYYTATPRTQDRLIGPRVLYRYGPDITATGAYDTASWGISAVADLIPLANDPDLTDAVKSCDAGWTRIPSIGTSTDGFFVCTNGTTRVNVRIYAKVPLATNSTDRRIYQTDTNVFIRSGP